MVLVYIPFYINSVLSGGKFLLRDAHENAVKTESNPSQNERWDPVPNQNVSDPPHGFWNNEYRYSAECLLNLNK